MVSLGLLLSRLFEVGMAHTYDTLLYGRSLWGVAFAEPFNTAYGTHWLGVHANFVLYPLAPLARVMEPWRVLVWAQSVAFGATIALIVVAALRAVRPAGDGELGSRSRVVPAWLVVVWAVVAVGGAPLLLNPFLFDARPDLIGVPLLLAAFLRVERRSGWDGAALAFVVAAALVREELAVMGAAGMIGFVAPRSDASRPAPQTWGWLRRGLAAAALVGAFAFYWFVVRSSLSDAYSAERAGRAATDLFGGATGEVGPYRVQLALAALSFGGGVALLGWRWLLAAVPGLAFVALATKQPENALNFHYALLAAPALAAASVSGLRVLLGASSGRVSAAAVPQLEGDSRVGAPSSRKSLVVVGGAVAVGLAATIAWGAHPLGARFQDAHFGFDAEAREWTAEVHTLLERIPQDEGAAVAPMFAAPFADRRDAWSLETLQRHLVEHEAPPEGVRWVAIENIRFATLGRVLVMQHGFTLEGVAAGRIALLRAPAGGTRVPGVLEAAADPECVHVAAEFPGVGIRVCDVARVGERVAAVAQRVDEARTPPLALVLEVGGAPVNLEAWYGMFDLATLPVGRSVQLRTPDRVRAPDARLHLQDRSGRAWAGAAPGGEPSMGVPIVLPAVAP